MTHISKNLHFLFTLLYPPLEELSPFNLETDKDRGTIRQILTRLQNDLRFSRDYQRIAFTEFNSGLYHLAWEESELAHYFFHKARFHGSLAQNDPFVCLAYFAEGCAYDFTFNAAAAFAVYQKAKTSLHQFRGLLRTRQTRRLDVFAKRLENQLEAWRKAMITQAQQAAAAPMEFLTDGERLYRWFEIKSVRGDKLRGFAPGDWVLAEPSQDEDGAWRYRELLIVGRTNKIGTISVQPYPLDRPEQSYYLGCIRDWVRDSEGIHLSPCRQDVGLTMRPQDLEGIVITHYQEQVLIDLM
ncbi:MAG: hypothetical protein KJ063_22840 [Anaerolineae bacterium]|nr:hypothetical protein [Anaerolineae bacterium]